jgi:hypothetical protein
MTTPHHKVSVAPDLSGFASSDVAADARAVSAQQVSWWSVHEHVSDLLDRVGSWPTVGTPAWCALDGDDPRKLAAIFDAARHWALRLETCQQAMCEASREISSAANWSAVALEIYDRHTSGRVPREVA